MHQIYLLFTFFLSLFSGLSFFVYFPFTAFLKVKMAGTKKIAVRGLATRFLKADNGKFRFYLSCLSNDVEKLTIEAKEKKNRVLKWLLEMGFEENEIEVFADFFDDHVKRLERVASEWDPNHNKLEAIQKIIKESPKYKIYFAFKLTTKKVDLLFKIKQGLFDNFDPKEFLFENMDGPEYFLTDFPNIRGDLLNEANKNALELAQKSAESLGGKLGCLLNFSQGYFSISHPDEDDSENNYRKQVMSLVKKIRIVNQVQYSVV